MPWSCRRSCGGSGTSEAQVRRIGRRQHTIVGVLLTLTACGGATVGPLPDRTTEIGRTAGPSCSRPRYCGTIGYVDCGSAVDGPAYFFERRTGKVVSACGGVCMDDLNGHCATMCPPAGWTCGHGGIQAASDEAYRRQTGR